jgi:hypothetical protein
MCLTILDDAVVSAAMFKSDSVIAIGYLFNGCNTYSNTC